MIGVTGANGFFAWHLRCRLSALRPEIPVKLAVRQTFESHDSLDRFVSGCDAVVHLAGANRGEDRLIWETNLQLANELVAAFQRTGSKPHVIYADTTHRGRDTAYGRSKHEAAEILNTWSAQSGSISTDLVFPNLFGECGRPYYNSAVATLCYEISRGKPSKLNVAGVTELMHAQDAAQYLIDNLDHKKGGMVRYDGQKMSITELYECLSSFARSYRVQHFPRLSSRLDLQLFNTLRSYLFPGSYPIPLDVHADPRGNFFELARGHGETQVSFSTTKPGHSRGEHFHLEKIERFVVLAGEGTIEVRRMFDAEVHRFRVSGNNVVAVDLPTMHTHNISNAGESDLLTAFWANDHFNRDAPDTFPERVTLKP